jgi:hypothetical protein
MKRLLAFSGMLTVGLVAFSLMGPATTAARADSLQVLCDMKVQCWLNNGPSNSITTTPPGNPYGTGWWAKDADTTWNGHEMYFILTGSGTCAWDAGNGSTLSTVTSNYCIKSNPEALFYPAPSMNGAIVNDYATGDLGHLACLTVLSDSLIGNFQCPPASEPLPNSADFYFAPPPG